MKTKCQGLGGDSSVELPWGLDPGFQLQHPEGSRKETNTLVPLVPRHPTLHVSACARDTDPHKTHILYT